ncbi:MAG: hypothetical protein HOW97_02520 [Catenulispora sp.]|nr:hypothetical protein [Catenulispora sp.]
MTTATDRRYLNRKQRELNTLRGIPNRVDATEARARLLEYRKTKGWVDIAAATGCSACHLRHIVSGRTQTINRATHNKIFNARLAPAPTRGLYIDATGTRRRVQALQAIGRSQQFIAEAANTTQHRINVITLGAPRVRQKVADKIAAAYEQLAHQPVPDNHFTRRVRRHAAAQGWHGPDFWDDVDRIDDPDFNPDATIPRARQVAEDARWLLDGGLHRDHIAQRLGVSRFYIDKALREHPDAGTVAA